MSIWQDLTEYRPTKAALAWTAAGASILTMVVGFTWGGWVTGGTADEMAADASRDAREQLVASVCVERFMADANAANSLIELKEASRYQQDDFIEAGGWITMTALDEPVTGAADLCADRLVAMEDIPSGLAAPATDAPTVGG